MKVGPFEVSGSYVGDCRDLLKQLPDGCVQTCVTSPPYYGLRDYGVDGQIGLEPTPRAYVDEMVRVFEDVRRVLREDGTLWLNLGDSYASIAGGYDANGSTGASSWPSIGKRTQAAVLSARRRTPPPGLKPKDLIGIPWMVAFALRDAGWYLRMDIVWHKPNPMPESVTDRPTKAHEYLFLMAKSPYYYYDADAIREPLAEKTLTTYTAARRSKGTDGTGMVASDNWARDVPVRRPKLDVDGEPAGANKRSVWTVATRPYTEAHFAVFPPDLIQPCILAGSRPGDLVLDPFFGSGTTGKVAEDNGRLWLGFDLNPAYAELQKKRTAQRGLCFTATKEG